MRPSAASALPARPPRCWLLPSALAPLEQAWDLPLPDALITLLRRRGFESAEAVRSLLEPPEPEPPELHYPDLPGAVERLWSACRRGEQVGICGDYDADGMTSTALLVGTLASLGASPLAAIPSRSEEGYGLNAAMVDRLADAGVSLIVTVDNGVSAEAGLERCRERGLDVVLTDHHTLPQPPPQVLALLHPATTPAGSPYRGLAGVGLAYVLAESLCRHARRPEAIGPARDLCCIGTLADMAPVTGVNRHWLRQGLPQLRGTRLKGLRALMQVAGVEDQAVGAEEVGFRIAPRLNAVGRLGDPLRVVTLLTSSDDEEALACARDCDQLNRQRRELCDAIEAEALALVDADGEALPPLLFIAQPHWHHGVIGIVAARLVDRYGRPVALLSSEGGGRLRASMRAPAGFAVDEALRQAADLLERYGGHPAAGGFTVSADRVAALRERLLETGARWLEGAGAAVPVRPEVRLSLRELTMEFWQGCRRLEPHGIGHERPLFWTPRCRVVEQRRVRGGHLQLTLEQDGCRQRGIAWRWDGDSVLPEWVDVAFHLSLNRFRDREQLQLELVDVRASSAEARVVLERRNRRYWCRFDGRHLHIRNTRGEELERTLSAGGGPSSDPDHPDHPYVAGLLQDACMALGLVS
ncbi:single-stranded-DNA-specific exonuclease RecJ [Synechococcus sp. RSCCF101]|uniref:single-stranded-DNA-specific exonuclease RecJ n=1 Tax=Synechococcus sp. RSCCF101 TaxID=2511069 RepID=UPI001247F171|nr:single-stranded-DNA-specific exonuclease RecJ [Synechococcus sp. RSCCF101]QEY31761.1 single-stranded-DNA-specific exonuclease RecJ [Synechococcus sp. RSCCF101]